MSAKDALEKYSKRAADERDREQFGRRKNEKPEFELTKKPCIKWMRANGWSMHVVESKAVWNHEAGRYMSGQTEPGFSDSVGCAPDGTSAWVEFKAPGKRSTLKEHQRLFLLDKIGKGCFAVCVDSVQQLELAWHEFKRARLVSRQVAIDFLIEHLPDAPTPRRQPLGESELPF